jgi:hypothetical protein
MAMLENYCIAIGAIRECEDAINRDGLVVAARDGMSAHPAFRIQSAASAEGEAKGLREALAEARRPFWRRWFG